MSEPAVAQVPHTRTVPYGRGPDSFLYWDEMPAP